MPQAVCLVKYIGFALRYLFRNFIYIFAFALLPSYFLAMSIDVRSGELLIREFFSGDPQFEFPALFSLLSPLNPHGWPFALICVATILVCMPMLLGLIEKHMRLGLRTWKGIWGRFNWNFLTTLVLIVIFMVVYELWTLLTAGLIHAEAHLFNGPACSAVVGVTLIALIALACYFASFFLLWLPCMQINGYGFMEAFSYSNQLVAKQRTKVFLSVFLPVIVATLLVVGVAAACGVAGIYVPVYIIEELMILLLFLYFSSLMFVAYFDLTGEERLDEVRR